jgi:threonine dehydrogenase-like Zn-dependent dehydrogenase
MLLDKVDKGELDPTIVITHRLALDDAPYGYKIFDEKLDNCIKVVLRTNLKPTRKPEE